MAIITNIKTRGSSGTSTLSGNIKIDEGAGELIITKKVNNDIVVVNKIDVNGQHYYNNAGKEINRIDVTGNHYYDTSGIERISTGVDTSTGYMRMLFKDTSGKSRTIIGQNPSGGDQIIAVTTSGKDVEQELRA
mgnify:CR=1 FL=1